MLSSPECYPSTSGSGASLGGSESGRTCKRATGRDSFVCLHLMEPAGFFAGPALQQSFSEFCKRPENKPAVEAAQRQEVSQALKLRETLQWVEFEKKLEQAGPQVQQALAPYLRHSVLRRVVQTLGNGTSSEANISPDSAQATGESEVQDLAAWATNPRVLGLLQHAKDLLDSGAMEAKHLEHLMVQQLKHAKGDARQKVELASSCSVLLPPEQLVSSLNEHLEERRKGNTAYKSGKLQEAMESYRRALAIVNFVKGANASDQAEVDSNKVKVLLNIAATCLALEDYGAAAQHCTQALDVEPGNPTALLRRAKAMALRREYQAAEKDLQLVESLPEAVACLDSVDDLRLLMQRLQTVDRAADRRFCAKLFQ